MSVKIQIRRGTQQEWLSSNPVLLGGELGIELDTNKWKIGNGVEKWSNLPYVTQGEKGEAGVGLEYIWNGTQLGVRREGEFNYQYVDLKGEKGEKGDTLFLNSQTGDYEDIFANEDLRISNENIRTQNELLRIQLKTQLENLKQQMESAEVQRNINEISRVQLKNELELLKVHFEELDQEMQVMIQDGSQLTIQLSDLKSSLEQYETQLEIIRNQSSQKIIETEIARQNAIIATDNANNATQNINIAVKDINDAISSAQFIWKNPVSNYASLSTIYPNPQIGWTAQTLNDGKVYRWNGNVWGYIVSANVVPSMANYIWIEEKTLKKGNNSFVLDNGVNALDKLIIKDLTYQAEWIEGLHWNRNLNTIAFTESSFDIDLNFRIINMGRDFKLDSENQKSVLDNYTDIKKNQIESYVNDVSKPTVSNYADNYFNNVIKPSIDNYWNDNSDRYEWVEYKTIHKGSNSMTLSSGVSPNTKLIVTDLKYGVRWIKDIHWTINDKTITLTESSLDEDLTFEIINMGLSKIGGI